MNTSIPIESVKEDATEEQARKTWWNHLCTFCMGMGLFVCVVAVSRFAPTQDPIHITTPTTSPFVYFSPAHPPPSSIHPGTDFATLVEGVSGSIFSGMKIRSFEGPRAFASTSLPPSFPPLEDPRNHSCTQWACVTTIHLPEVAYQRILSLPDWCLIIVGDKKTPSPFPMPASPSFVYLGEQEQLALQNRSGLYADFMHLIPWNHFGRKNIAYLYALAHGAQWIWDFDDDNPLYSGEAYDPMSILSRPPYMGIAPDCLAVNVYPYFGAPSCHTPPTPSWPRGFPLSMIIQSPTCSSSTWKPRLFSHLQSNISVYQSLANGDPDVDALFRLTRPPRFNFTSTHPSGSTLVVPPHSYGPTNAQATLFRSNAFWSLYLPVSVHGRVSDIWRGYIAQRMMRDMGLFTAYVSPLVEQIRNAHNYVADFEAEKDLYSKSEAFLHALNAWTSDRTDVSGRLEDLYIYLYERDFLGQKDVILIQAWLQALHKAHYSFPEVYVPPRTLPFPLFPPPTEPVPLSTHGYLALEYTGTVRSFMYAFPTHLINIIASSPYEVHLFFYLDLLSDPSEPIEKIHHNSFFISVNATLDAFQHFIDLSGRPKDLHSMVKVFEIHTDAFSFLKQKYKSEWDLSKDIDDQKRARDNIMRQPKTFGQFTSMRYVGELRRAYAASAGIHYTSVMRMRTDFVIRSNFWDLVFRIDPYLEESTSEHGVLHFPRAGVTYSPFPHLPLNTTTLFVPVCCDFGGLNDQFGWGPTHVMDLYDNRYNLEELQTYLKRPTWKAHAETLVANVMDLHNFTVVRLPVCYSILRLHIQQYDDFVRTNIWKIGCGWADYGEDSPACSQECSRQQRQRFAPLLEHTPWSAPYYVSYAQLNAIPPLLPSTLRLHKCERPQVLKGGGQPGELFRIYKDEEPHLSFLLAPSDRAKERYTYYDVC